MNKPYHHGDLARALLDAAAAILEQDGLPALTLRAIARNAGVSHMAPAHHFGDLTGLLSELAARGFDQFAASMRQAQAEPGARTPRRASAQAYVAFARTHPGLFLLMFRSERLDFSRPALQTAVGAAMQALMQTAASDGADDRAAGTAAKAPRAMLARAVLNWSIVHGFAMLLIDGRLDPVMTLAGNDWPVEAMLDDAFDAAFGAGSGVGAG